jgi:cytochrome c oxidase subunit II
MIIIAVLMSSIAYPTTSYGTSAAATLTIPIGAATPGNPAFEPAYLTIKEGEEVDVINEDSSPHTVTSGTGLEDPNAGKIFDTSIIPNQDLTELQQDYELGTANLEPGEYDFHCAIYPFKTGKLKVLEE